MTVATDKQLAEFHRAVTSAECAPDVSHALREFTRLEIEDELEDSI